jgi:hypothetical protein
LPTTILKPSPAASPRALVRAQAGDDHRLVRLGHLVGQLDEQGDQDDHADRSGDGDDQVVITLTSSGLEALSRAA